MCGAALAAWLVAASPARAAPPAAGGQPPSTNVEWRPGDSDAALQAAFDSARRAGQPVLLYWGATWCPPCNQLKATLFNRQDFAALARGFVAVHVDGDRPGAQAIGARFKVSGYPTMLLLAPDGRELTRLPGEVEPPQVLAALRAGIAGGRPVTAVLADAQAGRPLAPADWRLLAWYAWDDRQAALPVPMAERAALLADLARRRAAGGVDDELTTRLWLKALALSEAGQGLKPDAALRDRVLAVLADPVRSRLHLDLLVGAAPEMASQLIDANPDNEKRVRTGFDAALARLQADASLSRGDRTGALIGRVELARAAAADAAAAPNAAAPALPPQLLAEVRDTVRRFDGEIRDPYERQAVIPALAWLESRAGLQAEAEALLKANLERSHSPYYLMSQLGRLARQQGRDAEALDWYAQAWERSVGPATRLQWGSGYLGALLELAPADTVRIESAARRLFDEAVQDPAAFQERNARVLARSGQRLLDWSGAAEAPPARRAALERLQARLGATCARLTPGDASRSACEAILRPPAPGA